MTVRVEEWQASRPLRTTTGLVLHVLGGLAAFEDRQSSRCLAALKILPRLQDLRCRGLTRRTTPPRPPTFAKLSALGGLGFVRVLLLATLQSWFSEAPRDRDSAKDFRRLR
jgi:hypothetical protein